MRHKTNMQNLKAETSNFEQGGGGNDWMKLVEGRNIIRILPPWSEEGKFFQRVGFHRVPGNFSDKVVCPNFTFGDSDCPICKRSKGVYDKHGKDAAKNFWPQKRAYLNVLDMKAADGIVKVLEVGPTILNPILNFMAEEDSDDLVDPHVGFNIMIRRYKEGNFTKYEVMIKPGQFDLAQHGYDVPTILASLNDLSSQAKKPEADDFFDILDGINAKTFEGGDSGIEDDIPNANQAPQNNRPRSLDDDIPAGPGAGNAQAQNAQAQQAKPAPSGPTPLDDDDDDLPNMSGPAMADIGDIDMGFEADDIPF